MKNEFPDEIFIAIDPDGGSLIAARDLEGLLAELGSWEIDVDALPAAKYHPFELGTLHRHASFTSEKTI